MTQVHSWELTLLSLSPLHIGDSDANIVVDQHGYPFLPGTSWAGACRAFVTKNYGNKIALQLFGDQQQTERSKLMFSDGRSSQQHSIEVRTGIAIDGKTKTTIDRHLFNRNFLASGADFVVTLTLRVSKEFEAELLQVVNHMLHALHQGEIRLGGYTSIGGGKFQVSKSKYVCYDCTNEDDLFAYVKQTKPFKDYLLSDRRRSYSAVTFTLHGETETPLLIGGQYPNDSSKPDETFVTMIHEGEEKPYIPASSLKGSLRHRVERIAHVLSLDEAETYTDYLFGSRQDADKKQASTLQFEDVILENSRAKTYDRIAINPLTASVKDGTVIQEETVTGSFSMEVYFYKEATVKSDMSLALFLFALRDLAFQHVSIGSGGSIGRGFLNVKEIIMQSKEREVLFNIETKQVTDEAGWLKEINQLLKTANVVE